MTRIENSMATKIIIKARYNFDLVGINLI